MATSIEEHHARASFWSKVYHESPPSSPRSLDRRDSVSSLDSDFEEKEDLIDRLRDLVNWILNQICRILSWFPLLDQVAQWIQDDTPRINTESIELEDENSDSDSEI